jgi:hypothetical protein
MINFPNLKHLLNKNLTHITTGIKDADSGMMQWDDDYYSISFPS